VRVALITEGAYPYHASGASTWCHQLVSGFDRNRYAYQLVALTGTADRLALAYPLPATVAGVTAAPVWGGPATVPGRRDRRRLRRAATSAAMLLCRGLSGDDQHHTAMFRDALVRLAALAATGAHPLAGTPLADALADAWRAAAGARTAGAAGAPRLSVGDAEAAAALLERALRPLAVRTPAVDACHPTSGGLPLLVALATKWRAGTPYLLTEQGIYLRERYLDYGQGLPEAVKAVMLRFFRALSRLGYAEAATVVAASRFNQRWQLRHGAHPAKVVVVPGGVDPARFPVCADDPAGRTIGWVGRIEPRADLLTLIHAFWRVRQHLPDARLRLVGPVADGEYEAGCRELVRRLGLTAAVEFTGPVPRTANTYATAQVVARSSVCEGMPYAVVEAMMTGRATVSTDVGGVAELVGDTGLLVPPGEPAPLAGALVALLRDPARRRALADAAQRRARSHLTLDRTLRAYDYLYADLLARHQSSPAPTPSTPSIMESFGVSPGVSRERSMIDAGDAGDAGDTGDTGREEAAAAGGGRT
jgi:glycosyltransferase involved in cell wall biosynthesis